MSAAIGIRFAVVGGDGGVLGQREGEGAGAAEEIGDALGLADVRDDEVLQRRLGFGHGLQEAARRRRDFGAGPADDGRARLGDEFAVHGRGARG